MKKPVQKQKTGSEINTSMYSTVIVRNLTGTVQTVIPLFES